MTRLLAADGIALRAHLLENIAVAHLRLHDSDTVVAHRVDEPEVAHHSGHDGVLGQAPAALHIERAYGLDHVAVDLCAVGRHEHHSVGIAVVRHANVRTAFAHELGEWFEMGRTAVHVDVGSDTDLYQPLLLVIYSDSVKVAGRY